MKAVNYLQFLARNCTSLHILNKNYMNSYLWGIIFSGQNYIS